MMVRGVHKLLSLTLATSNNEVIDGPLGDLEFELLREEEDNSTNIDESMDLGIGEERNCGLEIEKNVELNNEGLDNVGFMNEGWVDEGFRDEHFG